MKSPNPSVRVISRALAFIATLMLCFGASLASAGSVGLDFQKSFAAPTIPLNGTTTLTFSIQNTDEFDDSEDFTVEDTLPAGLSVSNPGGASGTCNGLVTATPGGNQISLSSMFLEADESCYFSVDVTGTTPGVKNNTAWLYTTPVSVPAFASVIVEEALTSGSADFCDDSSYDNDNPQDSGLFTDLRRPTQINAVYGADPNECMLNLDGSTGSAGDMWITLLDPPGDTPAPTFGCVHISAEVLIKTFNNRKGIGFVTHYDPDAGKGLFLGLFDNGNTDGLQLWTFTGDADTPAKLTGAGPVANVFLGSKIQENVWYLLHTNVCHDEETGHLVASAAVESTDGPPLDQGFHVDIDWPDAPTTGQIGIAGWAKSSFVNSSVRQFSWDNLGAGGN